MIKEVSALPHQKQGTKKPEPKRDIKPILNDFGFPAADITSSNAIEVLEMVESIETAIAINDMVSLDRYTAVSYADAVQLDDNDDWYQNQAFYQSSGVLPDSGILANYNNNLLKDKGTWYGNNTEFY